MPKETGGSRETRARKWLVKIAQRFLERNEAWRGAQDREHKVRFIASEQDKKAADKKVQSLWGEVYMRYVRSRSLDAEELLSEPLNASRWCS